MMQAQNNLSVQSVKLQTEMSSWEDFDINSFTTFKYYRNQISNNHRYYHCAKRIKEGCKVKAKAEIQDDLTTVIITETGSHNHLPPPRGISEATKKKVKNFVKSNSNLPPSKMQVKFLEENANIQEIKPNLMSFQNEKKLICRNNDTVRNVLENYGTEYPSTTQFISLFSLNPFCVIMSLSEQRCFFSKEREILFVDDTHEMLNPTAYLMCIMGIRKKKGEISKHNDI